MDSTGRQSTPHLKLRDETRKLTHKSILPSTSEDPLKSEISSEICGDSGKRICQSWPLEHVGKSVPHKQLDGKLWPHLKTESIMKKQCSWDQESFAHKVKTQSSTEKLCAGSSFQRSFLNGCKKGRKATDQLTLKKTVIPQDTHVTVVGASSPNPVLVLPPKFMFFQEEFPDLSLSFNPKHKISVPEPTCRGVDAESTCTCPSRNDTILKTPKKLSKKQPKSCDPIQINIMEMLQDLSKRSRPYPRAHFHRSERKSGSNSLALSNVIFKRGKHRETPVKKRYSKLKLVILEERKRKQAIKGQQFLGETHTKITQECEGENGLVQTPSYSSGIVSGLLTEESQVTRQEASADQKHVLVTKSEEHVTVESLVEKELKPEQDEISDHKLSLINSVEQPQNLIYSGMKATEPFIHSRKFREYCQNVRSQNLDDAVVTLLKELYRFQDRVYKKDPIRAHAKRRFVLGIREVKKFLKLKKLKVVIIAPDIESINSPGGLDEAVDHIKEEGKLQEIPVVFAASRQKLGYITMKKVPVSVVGVISYDGAEELLKQMLDQWKKACDLYKEQSGRSSESLDQQLSIPCPEWEKKDVENKLARTIMLKLKEDDSLYHVDNAVTQGSCVDEVQESLSSLSVE